MDGAWGAKTARDENPGEPKGAPGAAGRGREMVMARIIAKGVAHPLSHPPDFRLRRRHSPEIAEAELLTTYLRR